MGDSAFRDMCPFLFVLLLSCSKLLSFAISKLFYINWIWFSSEAFKLWLRSPLDFSKVMSSALGWAKFSEPIVPCGVLSSIFPQHHPTLWVFSYHWHLEHNRVATIPLWMATRKRSRVMIPLGRCLWMCVMPLLNTFRAPSTAGQIPLGLRQMLSQGKLPGRLRQEFVLRARRFQAPPLSGCPRGGRTTLFSETIDAIDPQKHMATHVLMSDRFRSGETAVGSL